MTTNEPHCVVVTWRTATHPDRLHLQCSILAVEIEVQRGEQDVYPCFLRRSWLRSVSCNTACEVRFDETADIVRVALFRGGVLQDEVDLLFTAPLEKRRDGDYRIRMEHSITA